MPFRQAQQKVINIEIAVAHEKGKKQVFNPGAAQLYILMVQLSSQRNAVQSIILCKPGTAAQLDNGGIAGTGFDFFEKRSLLVIDVVVENVDNGCRTSGVELKLAGGEVVGCL